MASGFSSPLCYSFSSFWCYITCLSIGGFIHRYSDDRCSGVSVLVIFHLGLKIHSASLSTLLCVSGGWPIWPRSMGFPVSWLSAEFSQWEAPTGVQREDRRKSVCFPTLRQNLFLSISAATPSSRVRGGNGSPLLLGPWCLNCTLLGSLNSVHKFVNSPFIKISSITSWSGMSRQPGLP